VKGQRCRGLAELRLVPRLTRPPARPCAGRHQSLHLIDLLITQHARRARPAWGRRSLRTSKQRLDQGHAFVNFARDSASGVCSTWHRVIYMPAIALILSDSATRVAASLQMPKPAEPGARPCRQPSRISPPRLLRGNVSREIALMVFYPQPPPRRNIELPVVGAATIGFILAK